MSGWDEYLALTPIERGDLRDTTEAERRCYEIGYHHGLTFATECAETVVWKRTMRRIWRRIWDCTEPFPWRVRCHHCGRPSEADGDHSCPCLFTDEECPNHSKVTR